jgi:CRP/FNR family transcriptional regulator, polysaccharide utilization system transcription regulator
MIKDIESFYQCQFYKESRLFLSEKNMQLLERNTHSLNFKHAETIFKQGDTSSHIALLNKGVVKFNFEEFPNRNLILSIVSAPKILGGANMFYRRINLFSITAVGECEVFMVDMKILPDLLMQNGKYALMLFQKAMEMFETSILNYISLANKNVNGRLADILIYLSDHVYKSNSFHLLLTRKEIAEFAGCSKENVIHTLTRWNDEKIIRSDVKTITILDREKLKVISRLG